MNFNREYIESIIIRSLNNEASKGDQLILEYWLKDSVNLEEYLALKALWNDSEIASLPVHFDTAKAWQSVSEKIDQISERKAGGVLKSLYWRKNYTVAALFFILLMSGFIFFLLQSSQSSAWKFYAEANTEFSLKDGSQITLRKGSTIRIPADFGQTNRKLELEGDAYFDVIHDDNSAFEITTRHAVIRDLGTVFSVHSNDTINEVTVISGEVQLQSRTNAEKQVLLKPGMKGRLTEEFISGGRASVGNDLAWQTGKLRFENTSLTTVINDISNFYEVKFSIDPDILKKKVLVTASFQDQPIGQVTEELQLFTGLHFRKTVDGYFISQ